jgi:hypothetical protein
MTRETMTTDPFGALVPETNPDPNAELGGGPLAGATVVVKDVWAGCYPARWAATGQ